VRPRVRRLFRFCQIRARFRFKAEVTTPKGSQLFSSTLQVQSTSAEVEREKRTCKRERTRYSRYAKATFRKDRRLNIRLSSKDLEAIQKRALEEGLPYQTLISSLLHKYASGRLKESK
jgi:predicted DNA binding CopG/RHH family protein